MSPSEDSTERYFFVHLQKTAGTTLYRMLRREFGEAAVYPQPRYQQRPHVTIDVDSLVERFARHRGELRAVAGHFPLCTIELLDAEFRTFTVLREPVERTLSFLRHQRVVAPQFADAGLEEIYDDHLNFELLIRDHMVRMLSLRTAEMTDGAITVIPSDRARLDRARHALEHEIDVMGVQEELDDFCRLLSDRFGWDLGRPERSNTTPAVEVPSGLRERIEEDCALDVELYRFAVDLWRRRRAADAGAPVAGSN